MLRKILTELYERDLVKLKEEIAGYGADTDIWKTADGITNSGGNLCLHICGNLNHFFGAVLGETGYVRDRDAEFSANGFAAEELVRGIETAQETVMSTLASLTEDDLDKPYPIDVFGHPMTTGFFLTHLSTHLTYHLGQINYHRRLLAS